MAALRCLRGVRDSPGGTGLCPPRSLGVVGLVVRLLLSVAISREWLPGYRRAAVAHTAVDPFRGCSLQAFTTCLSVLRRFEAEAKIMTRREQSGISRGISICSRRGMRGDSKGHIDEGG